MKRSILFVLASIALLLAASCDKGNKYGVTAPDELGMVEGTITLPKAEDDFLIPYYSNKAGTVSLANPDDASWLRLGAATFGDKDGSISAHVTQNDGYPRRAEVLFTSDSREESVIILQEGGQEETFLFPVRSTVAYNGAGGKFTIPVNIGIPLDRVRMEIRLSGTDEWIHDLELTATTLSFCTNDNTDKLELRRGHIALSFVDGWKKTQEVSIAVFQPREDNVLGNIVSFEDLRALASLSGFPIPEDAIVEGYIVSTTEGGNAGDAIVEDYEHQKGTIDYTLTERTSYLESPDGKYGFRLICEDAEFNKFDRYSHVLLKLGGATVRKSFGSPTYYTIEGASSNNIITSEDGYATMPWKEKHIGDLTDDDIHTLVKIKDCEIAMRKGPFTPVNEGYGTAHGYNRLAKYPILIRDIEGSSMYMFTNMTCKYRRNGETLPYGSGDITGIVVHEEYKSFEQDGDIGRRGNSSRYQLRHLTREDIDLKADFEDSFSGIITEFRYAKFGKDGEGKDDKTVLLATKGNGEMRHTYGAVDNFYESYFYIGKCGSGDKYKGKYEEGAGIELDGGGIYQPWVDNHTESAQNTNGKGWFHKDLMLSWSNKYWWNSNRGYCWLATFSTEDITSNHVSLQFAMHNNAQGARSPRYWKAEYSTTTTSTAAADDGKWVLIGEFTVPDVVTWDPLKCENNTAGTRVYDFTLPTVILGHPEVSIRLMPRNNKAATTSASSYDDSTITNGTGFNTMDYFAVRYNK